MKQRSPEELESFMHRAGVAAFGNPHGFTFNRFGQPCPRVRPKNSDDASEGIAYQEYLQTPWYESLRFQVLSLCGECYWCGSEEDLACHHLSYRALGQERVGVNVVAACSECH